MTYIEGLEEIDVNDFIVAFIRNYANYTPDEKLDKLMKYIPDVIANFSDCDSEEEYRMLAKNGDGTLAKITIADPKSGYKLYKPIELNAEDYKKFYYQTLSYSLIYYIMFFMGAEFDIVDNKNKLLSGTLRITPEQLPHILGLENRYVSNKPCALLEKIIPGYNSQNVLGKILSIIEHNDKIIEYEKETGLDIFNYYKNMQKNKDFLMLGRIFSEDEKSSEEYNKILLLQRSDNQLSLYKRSNMNDSMNRNICKMIIQRDEEGNYFPRSLQGLSEQVLDTNEALELLRKSPRHARHKGIDVTLYAIGELDEDIFHLVVKRDSDNLEIGRLFKAHVHCEIKDDLRTDRACSKDFDIVASLIDTLNGELGCLEKYSDLARHEVNAGGKIVYMNYDNGFKISSDKHQREVIRMRLLQNEMDAVAEIISSTKDQPTHKLQDYEKSTTPKPIISKEERERLFNEYHRRIFSPPNPTTNNKRR